MSLDEAIERVERELFLAYDEEVSVSTAPFSDGEGGYEQVTTFEETDRAKRYREAMETIREL